MTDATPWGPPGAPGAVIGAAIGVPTVVNVKDEPYNGVPAATAALATDQTTAILAAIADCEAGGGGIVFLDRGFWGHTATIELPDSVRLVGVTANSGPGLTAPRTTRLIALAGFPAMCPQVTIGPRLPASYGTTGLVFGTRVENLMVDGNFIAWFGIYTNKAQEHCEVSYVTTQRHLAIGVWAATPNGSPGANQTNNFGMRALKCAIKSDRNFVSTTLTGGAPVVGAAGVNPYDSASNFNKPVTTPGQASGVVKVTSTAGIPPAGVMICAPTTADNPPIAVLYDTVVDGTTISGCLTDANPTTGGLTPATAIDTAKGVDFGGYCTYVQGVGAFRGIDGYTMDVGVAGSGAVGLRLDGCNGIFTRGHCESVKYGVLLNRGMRCNGVHLDGLMTGDATMDDLVRIENVFGANSQWGLKFTAITNRVNGSVNTINDLLNGKIVKDGYVAEYSIGDSSYGNATFGRPILSAASSILSKFTKGFFLPKKASAFVDGDFNDVGDGLIGVRTDSGDLEWRAAGAWRSTASLGGGGGSAYYPWTINKLLGWAWDPINNNTGAALTAGQLMLTKVAVTPGATLANVLAYVSTAGATLTAGQCFAAVYDASGDLIGTSADQSGQWNSTGLKTMALTEDSAGSLTLGPTASWVYVALLANGTTMPVFATQPGVSANTLANAGLTASGGANGYRGGTILTGQTVMPSSIVLGNVANIGNARWAGVS